YPERTTAGVWRSGRYDEPHEIDPRLGYRSRRRRAGAWRADDRRPGADPRLLARSEGVRQPVLFAAQGRELQRGQHRLPGRPEGVRPALLLAAQRRELQRED